MKPQPRTQEGKLAGSSTVPLNEVAYGVRFVAPDFSVVHFGEYYDCIKERFPAHQDVTPIARPTPVPDQFELPALPRVWFPRASRLIQLQLDRFNYNWRHGADDAEPMYPGFGVLFPEFKGEWAVFHAFTGGAFKIPVTLVELSLTYVNYIHAVDDLESPIFIFRENEWRRELPEPEFWVSQFRFVFPNENLKLIVSARPAIQLNTQQAATAFEITLQSLECPKFDDSEGIFRWFVAAHDKVHFAFRKLVREEWRAAWGFND
ncbi:MAG: TIGR04255 family protein [Vulcanimicrobiaceae bacterium]